MTWIDSILTADMTAAQLARSYDDACELAGVPGTWTTDIPTWEALGVTRDEYLTVETEQDVYDLVQLYRRKHERKQNWSDADAFDQQSCLLVEVAAAVLNDVVAELQMRLRDVETSLYYIQEWARPTDCYSCPERNFQDVVAEAPELIRLLEAVQQTANALPESR